MQICEVPVKYIGLGESMEALQLFNKRQFVDSLFKIILEVLSNFNDSIILGLSSLKYSLNLCTCSISIILSRIQNNASEFNETTLNFQSC